MSIKLDATARETGTRFRIYPQPPWLKGFENPETVWVSVTPDQIKPGPLDDRMYAVDPIWKMPYDGRLSRPPYRGPYHPPVEPDPRTGHFDHLDVNGRQFKTAHMYAAVRRVLDIWEDHFHKPIDWFFRIDSPRLELIPLVMWDNAQSGYGFLEFGFGRTSWRGIDPTRPYCLHFDVLAHELGHTFIFSEVDAPEPPTNLEEYRGFHESAADLVSIVSSLHFQLVADLLLQRTAGNLFTENELARLGELSQHTPIRNAFNYERMSTVNRREPHKFSQPLTGAVFDVFVEVFQKELVKNHLISQELADRSYHGPDEAIDDTAIQREFQAAYEGRHDEFKIALLRARDYLGELLAKSWNRDRLPPNNLTFAGFGSALLTVDLEMTGGQHQQTIRDCFAWREIEFPADSMMWRTWRVADCGLMDVEAMNRGPSDNQGLSRRIQGV